MFFSLMALQSSEFWPVNYARHAGGRKAGLGYGNTWGKLESLTGENAVFQLMNLFMKEVETLYNCHVILANTQMASS